MELHFEPIKVSGYSAGLSMVAAKLGDGWVLVNVGTGAMVFARPKLEVPDFFNVGPEAEAGAKKIWDELPPQSVKLSPRGNMIHTCADQATTHCGKTFDVRSPRVSLVDDEPNCPACLDATR